MFLSWQSVAILPQLMIEQNPYWPFWDTAFKGVADQLMALVSVLLGLMTSILLIV